MSEPEGWTAHTVKEYLDTVRAGDELRIARVEHALDQIIERLLILERWHSTIAGKTTIIVAIISFMAAMVGILFGHLLPP